MKMLYRPSSGLGEPVEVEVLEIDFVRGSARVRVPLGSDALVNVFAREAGEPEIGYVHRTVRRCDLENIPEER